MNAYAVQWVAQLPHQSVSALAFRVLLLLALRVGEAESDLSPGEASALLASSYNNAGLALVELYDAGHVTRRPGPATGKRGRPPMRYAMRWPPERAGR